MPLTFSYRQEQWLVAPSEFSIAHVFTGLELYQLKGQLISNQAKEIELRHLSGVVFDGQFQSSPIALNDQPQQLNLTITDVESGKILALEKQSGISVQGKLSGQLPVFLSPDNIEIKSGKLVNSSAGQLRIENNAAFEAVKQKQPALAEVLSLLEYLDFETLNSDVSLSKDGWLTLDMALMGFNAKAQQEVNFNYTHRENVFTLMKALRMGDVIKDKVQQEFERKNDAN
nr:YdbH domain-containing protein [Marinifaba aquimaris]